MEKNYGIMINEKLKVAIFAQEIVNRGGAERIILEQARLFNADIYTGKYDRKTTFDEFKNMKIEIVPSKFSGRLNSLYLYYKFRKMKLRKKYDLYILHGGAVLGLAKKYHPNLWYCHCPIRWLYDMYKDELNKMKGAKKIVFIIISSILRIIDKNNVMYVDKIVTNSINVKKRVKRIYRRNSDVVYPFVDI